MRVALLARVSTEEQAEAGRHSMPVQLAEMRARCEREGWAEVAVFEAPGESASTRRLDRRPVLGALVTAAKAGQFDAVMFHESSRLARDEELAQWLINELEEVGVRLVSASRDVDYYYSPEGRFHFAMETGLDAWQRRKHRQQVLKGKRGRFDVGLPSGDIPFGYEPQWVEDALGRRRDPSKPPVVVPAEAEAVRRAFAMRVAGEGYVAIASMLNRRGMRPRSKQGNVEFTASSVQSLLENDFYAGFVRYRTDRKVGAHEPVITETEWAQAQAVVQRQSAPRARSLQLLTGMASCARCEAPMWQVQTGTRGGYYYYRESRRGECVGGKMWRVGEADALVERTVMAMATDTAWLARLERRAMRDDVEEHVRERRARLQAKRERATRAFVAGALGEDEWKRMLAAVEAELAAVPELPEGGMLFPVKRFRSIADVWAGMTLEEKREGLGLLFERLYVDTARRDVQFAPREWCAALFEDRHVYCLPPAGVGGWERTSRHWASELVA